MTRSQRFRYIAAWVLFVLMIATAVFGSVLKPHGTGTKDYINFEKRMVNGEERYVTPPFKPELRFPFGTDHRGYDILSLMLNGMKYTLGFAFSVTLARFAVGLPLGLFAGVWGKGRGAVSALQVIFTAVPAILFVFPAVIGVYRTLHVDMGLPPGHPNIRLFFILCFILLVFVGVFHIAGQFSERAYFFSGKPYVTAARVMGAGNGRIIWRHVLPQLRSEIVFAFLDEYVQVMFLMGQLAVLGIFIFGGEVFDMETPGYTVFLTTSGEWCSMIAYGAAMVRIFPWIIFSSGGVFTVSILIVQFFLNQLKGRSEREALHSGIM